MFTRQLLNFVTPCAVNSVLKIAELSQVDLVVWKLVQYSDKD